MIYKAGTQVMSHLTYDQAQTQLHENLKQSLRAFPGGARLTPRGPDNPLPCSDSDGAPPSTPVSIQSWNWLEPVATSGNDQYVTAFVHYWTGQGWTVSVDQRPKDQYVVLTSKSGFEMFMQLSVDGAKVTVGGASPCVPPKQAGASPSSNG